MEKKSVIQKMQGIFIDVLEDENIHLSPETTANDIDEWDSLNHIQLVVEIEKFFKIKFSSTDIEGFENVGDMAEAISTKLSS